MSIGPGGSGHFSGSGADLATGFVAGTAALVDSYRPGLTAQQLTDRLTSTAYPGAAGTRSLTGAGTVDPAGAVTAVLPTSAPRPARPEPAPQLAASTGHSAHAGAVAVAGGAAGLIALTAFFAVVLPRARRRGWRAGSDSGAAGLLYPAVPGLSSRGPAVHVSAVHGPAVWSPRPG